MEGAYLHHCVGGYVSRMAAGETAILLIREENDRERPFYTLEWREGRVVQCRTRNNKSYREDERVSAFVDAWAEWAAQKSKKRHDAA